MLQVMVVDDDVISQVVAEQVIRSQKWTAVKAGSGQQCLDYIKSTEVSAAWPVSLPQCIIGQAHGCFQMFGRHSPAHIVTLSCDSVYRRLKGAYRPVAYRRLQASNPHEF